MNLPTVLSFLLSFSALRDWLKLLVIGGTIETCRRLCMQLWVSFIESFWITACFEERDVSYSKHPISPPFYTHRELTPCCYVAWLLFWLSKQPKWSKSATLTL